MIVKFFRNFSLGVIVFISLFFVFYAIWDFFNINYYPLFFDGYHTHFYGFIQSIFEFGVFEKVIYFVLVLLNVILISRLNQRHIILSERNYMPAIFYLIIVFSLPQISRLNPALLASTLILIIIDKCLLVTSKDRESTNFYEAGFLLTLATFFYPPALFLIPILFLSLTILKKATWREWIFVFLGLLSPILIFITLVHIFNLDYFVYQHYFNLALFSDAHIQTLLTNSMAYFVIYLFFLIFISLIFFIRRAQIEKIHSRKILVWITFILLNSILIAIYLKSVNIEIFYLIAIPASILISYYFSKMKKLKIGNILILTLFIYLIINNIGFFVKH